MKEDKTIIRYPTFKVVQKENGKYWYKPVKGDEEEVLLIYNAPMGIHDPDYPERTTQCDIYGISCYDESLMYFVKGRTFKTGSTAMISTVYEILSDYADRYEEIGSAVFFDYILSYVSDIPDTVLTRLGHVISDSAEFLDEYPCDFLEAIKDYWRYILVIETDQDDKDYDHHIIFTDSDVVFNEIGQKRIIDGIDRDIPIFPF